MTEAPAQIYQTGITHEGTGAKPENVPSMTAEEEQAFFNRRVGGDRPVDVGGEDNGNSKQAERLAEEIAADGSWGAGDGEGETDARGPQRGREGRSADSAAPAKPAGDVAEEEAEAEAAAPPWRIDTWTATAADFDAEEKLAEVPEAHRPVVAHFARLAGERAARAEEGVAAKVDALAALENGKAQAAAAKLEEVREKVLLPALERLQNAGVLDAQRILDEITNGINKAADHAEELHRVQQELHLERWRNFTREAPEAKALLDLAKRGDKEAKSAYETFKRGANLSLRDGWALTKAHHPEVFARLAPKPPASAQPAAPVVPAAPPSAPAVARQHVAPPAPPPSRMEPRAAPPPPARTRPSVPAPEPSLDDMLAEGWSNYKQSRQ